ncbi:MAG: hypothetical protein HYU67_05115 [Flavobacteriia bacterium]|nr:hypothetical protein [Flavobacteriia bacterium]
MTPKEENLIRRKIARVKADLVADKRRWGGCYHDGSGNRYKPPHLYLQLGDFDEGLRYMNWFDKNFPDDSCDPVFFFEWTVILFMKKKYKEAKRKAFKTYCSNIYVFDKYFGKELKKVEKSEKSNTETLEYCINFEYSFQNEEFSSFNIWLT